MRGRVAELGAEVGPQNTPRALVGRRREGQAGPEGWIWGCPRSGRATSSGGTFLVGGGGAIPPVGLGRERARPGLGVAVRSSGRGERTLGSARARGRGRGDGDRERGSRGGALREGPRAGRPARPAGRTWSAKSSAVPIRSFWPMAAAGGSALSLARLAFGLSAPAPAPAAASTGSARRPASFLVGSSSGCHVGQALKGPRRRARPGRALKGPRTARSRTAPRALSLRPPRFGHAHPSRRAAAPAAHTGPAHHPPAPPAVLEAPPIAHFKAAWPDLEGPPAGGTRGYRSRQGHGTRQTHLGLRIPPRVGDGVLARRIPH